MVFRHDPEIDAGATAPTAVEPSSLQEADIPVPRFLKPEEVADELTVTVSQVYTLMRSGQLPAVKIGRRGVWRVSREALEAYIEGLEASARERAPSS